MNENKLYYNTPWLPAKIKQPVVAVGTYWMQNENEPPSLYFIIKRDLSVPIQSFTFLYRFSPLSIQYKDEDNPFYRFQYTGNTVNEKTYYVLRGTVPDSISTCRCTAVVSEVILKNGEVLTYYSKDFIDPSVAKVRSLNDAEGYLKEYFAYKAQHASLSSANTESIRKPQWKPHRRTVKYITAATAFLVLAGLLIGVASIRNNNTDVLTDSVPRLLAEHRYSEAYKIIRENNDDPAVMQDLCDQAAAYFLANHEYKNAYLYAYAAPAPFHHEVVNAFIDFLLEENRPIEAFDFLKTEGSDLPDTLEKVCKACVDSCINTGNYTQAYTYAKEVPQSLESEVIPHLLENMIQNGKLDTEAFFIIENVVDDTTFSSVTQEALTTLLEQNNYNDAAVVASKIRSADEKAVVLEELCSSGLEYYMQQNNLNHAISLFETCSASLREDQTNKFIQTVVDYCQSVGHCGGIVYFQNQLGNNTADIVINREDLTIRSSFGKSYFLLTADQKRAYHANPFDLYKDAYLIQNGTVSETDIVNAVSVSTSVYQTVVLLNDGSVTALDNGHGQIPALPTDKDFVQIDCGQSHVLLLRDNGSVTAVGSNKYGQCSVNKWENIVKVAAGADFSVGLCSDGTLVAVGSNRSGQCDVLAFRNVIDIAACDQTLVVLLADGSVHLAGDISMGFMEAEYFTDIRRIRASGTCIIGERNDGTYVMASGAANADCGSVQDWKDLSLFAAGSLCVGYVDPTGAIIVKGDGAPIIHQGYESNEQ